MGTIGPYTLRETLGSCQVGRAWLATDSAGAYVTVAVLEPPAAQDGQWRGAFAAVVGNLSQPRPGAPTIVGSDFAGAYPWVACALDGGPGAAQVFTALGQPYTPAASASTSPPAVIVGRVVEPATEPLSPQPPQTFPGAEAPASGIPASGIPASGPPISGIPASGAPAPQHQSDTALVPFTPTTRPAEATFDSGDPWATHSGAAGPRPASQPAVSPFTPWEPPPSAFHSGGPRIEPTARPPRGRRVLLWSALVFLVLLLLGGGGAGAYVALQKQDPKPKASASASTKPSGSSAPTAPSGQGPSQPGLEPPKDGDWPTKWPKFEVGDKSKSMNNPFSLGFSFKIPDGWGCIKKDQSGGTTHLVCEGPGAEGAKAGGDIIVRTCTDPCDSGRRVTMRQQEEAWGAQWIRAGGFAAWAETSQAGGTPRYGLAYVAYWRSVPDKAIDRQLVFRMTASPDNADVIRRIANSVRDGIK